MTMRDDLEAAVKRASDALKQFPRGSMGLIPDAIKFSSEYRVAKREYDLAFFRLRAFNAKCTTGRQ